MELRTRDGNIRLKIDLGRICSAVEASERREAPAFAEATAGEERAEGERRKTFCGIGGDQMATMEDFDKLDIRLGKIVRVDDFPEARKPAYKLTIDFGPEIGVKGSSVQITHHYKKDELVGKLVLGVVNFPPRKIGPFFSETSTLGVPDSEGRVILVVPDRGDPQIGGKLF